MKTNLGMVLVWVVVFLALAGCESYKDGITALCNSPNTCEQCAQVYPEQRLQVLYRHILDVVKNGRARALAESLADLSDEERADILRQAAAEVGLEGDCRLADMFAGVPMVPQDR
ncbi:MAG: hypothetical protein JW797_05790 [Bradymonadales bacterium]|nr:hypothetical protein [Bradymonadales bacterium]